MLDSIGAVPTVGLGCLVAVVLAALAAAGPWRVIHGTGVAVFGLGLLAVPFGLLTAGVCWWIERVSLATMGLSAAGYGTLAVVGGLILALATQGKVEADEWGSLKRDRPRD